MTTAYSTSVYTDGAELVSRVAPRASMRAYRTLGELFSTAARGGSMREDCVHLVNLFGQCAFLRRLGIRDLRLRPGLGMKGVEAFGAELES